MRKQNCKCPRNRANRSSRFRCSACNCRIHFFKSRGFFRLRLNRPLRSCIEPLTGTIVHCPFLNSTKSKRVPAQRLSSFLILFGMLTRPRESILFIAILVNRHNRGKLDLAANATGRFLSRSLRCRRPNDYPYDNSRRLRFRVIHTLGGLHEVRRLGVGDVHEGLRVAIGERKP